jgi:hypothetical protein
MGDIEDYLSENEKSKTFEIDLVKLHLRSLELLVSNNYYLAAILKRQLELKELLKGDTESNFDEKVKNQFLEISKKIENLSNQHYLDLFSQITIHD